MEKTTITLPDGLRDRAHAAGINVSGVAANAVMRSVKALEKETGVHAAKQNSPAVTSCGGTS